MAGEPSRLVIARFEQDVAGHIIGGKILYPPSRVTDSLGIAQARELYLDAGDGFDITQTAESYKVVTLFGHGEVEDIPVSGDEAVDVGALVLALEPLLEAVPFTGERVAIIIQRPVA